ncbi:MAG: N-acyl homoserine lactonase family protein [Salaquimonas sp.]
MSDHWEVFALKYADQTQRVRGNNFIGDPNHNAPYPIDFYVWLLRKGNQTILVDTGFDEGEALARDRPILDSPAVMVKDFGYSPDAITDIILTHLHFDHAGSLKAFPNAKLHVQASEMEYATGPCMCHDHIRQPFTGEHICDMVRSLYAGRVSFCEGSREIAPGVEVHLIGGHSKGLQCVRVLTQRGWVVLASDASHFYENYQLGKPFPIVVDMEEMLNGFNRLYDLADSPNHIIPGHDPLVRDLYPGIEAGSNRIVQLHANPKKLF